MFSNFILWRAHQHFFYKSRQQGILWGLREGEGLPKEATLKKTYSGSCNWRKLTKNCRNQKISIDVYRSKVRHDTKHKEFKFEMSVCTYPCHSKFTYSMSLNSAIKLSFRVISSVWNWCGYWYIYWKPHCIFFWRWLYLKIHQSYIFTICKLVWKYCIL